MYDKKFSYRKLFLSVLGLLGCFFFLFLSWLVGVVVVVLFFRFRLRARDVC